jgi:hypothetical protein
MPLAVTITDLTHARHEFCDESELAITHRRKPARFWLPR